MKKVLVLGAGLVTRPLVDYLLDKGFELTVASRTVSKAEALVGDHPNGTALELNVKDGVALEHLIAESDLVISLVPYTFHVKVAGLCIKHAKHFVSTSYVSPEMGALDGPAKDAGVVLLNEIGLDPGIDHMSAMKIIDAVHGRRGQIKAFRSYCGGLPAPEANDNPFGYKFSWSPIGVMLAGTNDARFKEGGEIVEIPGAELFDHYKMLTVEGLGEFEGYANRDSVPYIETYGIPETDTMFRGTYRNVGWCPTLKAIADLGFFDKEERDFAGMTLADYTRSYVGGTGELKADAAAKLGIAADDAIMGRLEWLGLFSDEPVRVEKGSSLEVLAALMNEKMPYRPGERDMIVLTHEFIAERPDGKKRITSTLIDYGIPDGDSAMARTVSLPAAIGARMILEGVITRPGVSVPVSADIYEPILTELTKLGIKCMEREEDS
ncbi:MAG: saccharopine dehydrogenase NADP-binding domain-containing protein [Candidatus Coatesbacteria bacterium]|nr:MAG: saccharopine dehydrogenase NADP-binding domain-containing protein [Candidatus Coatesbacteria bacterium]